MLLTLDLHGTQTKTDDFHLLQAYLQQVVGQPFLHFRFSYGDELSLHFGEPRPYPSPKLKHLVKGSYILGARASRWFLRAGSPPVVVFCAEDSQPHKGPALKPMSQDTLEQSEVIQRGARIALASVVPFRHLQSEDERYGSLYGYGLSLVLSDGSSFLIAPESADRLSPADAIADWELFTPEERHLSVGPGVWWSYLPSRHSP